MRRYIPIAILSTMSLFTLVLGLSFFMMKSPAQQIENYQNLASGYLDQAQDTQMQKSAALYLFDEAKNLISHAIALNPYDQELQSRLHVVAGQKRDFAQETNTAFLPHKEIIQ